MLYTDITREEESIVRTVKEVSILTGVSIRTLHYYDSIGLLQPTQITESGYRLYDDAALERLQSILLFRELQFPLKEIKKILESPSFDRNKALKQQIELLRLRKEHLENLIDLARGIQMIGVKTLDFSAFDTRKIDEYAAQAKAAWGGTEAYQEYEQKSKKRTKEEEQLLSGEMMELLKEFGLIRAKQPSEEQPQQLVKKLQAFITKNYYTCTLEILQSLGTMYADGGRMTENIDQVGGAGTAEFIQQAINIYCSRN